VDGGDSGNPRCVGHRGRGILQLSSRAYLRSNAQFDPVQLGAVRVHGYWTWPVINSYLGTLEVLTRTDAVPDPGQTYEATNGLEFNLRLGPSYTGVAVIRPRGAQVQVGPNTVTGTLTWYESGGSMGRSGAEFGS
jgi:hypothetical protein